MTNFDKLTRWDADFYRELTDDECIVCLTEREVYLVGQITDAIKWSGTRWIGNLVGLDFDEIASNLEYKLADRVTCQNVTKLLEKITSLENKIDYIFNETVINEGDTIVNKDTPAWDATTTEEFADNYTFSTDACDTADKDALYGGIYQLVRYVNQVNIDALQSMSQLGNLAQQIDKLISAATGGLTPMDEVAAYVDFLVNELLEEYEATVDEALLDEVTCDLFCIAVGSNCSINLSDVINYYGGKIGTTAIDLTNSLASVMQFALTGTFSGDEYFYFMSTFQFITVALTDNFFSVDGMNSYMVQIAAGSNSPDNDWTLLCDACPPLYRLHTTNFAYGLGNWTIQNDNAAPNPPLGELSGLRLQGTLNAAGTQKVIAVTWDNFDPLWRIVGGKFYHEQANASASAQNTRIMRYRQTADSNIGASTPISTTGITNGVFEPCVMELTYNDDNRQLLIQLTVLDDVDSECYLDKVELLFELNHAPARSVVTEDSDLCV